MCVRPLCAFNRDSSNKMLEEIMGAVLPEDEQEELPTGFSCVGHIGMHLAVYYIS